MRKALNIVLTFLLVAVAFVVALPAMAQTPADLGNMMLPQASLVAVLLAVPALYLLRGPIDPR